ncbi:hypothetical protein K2Z84_24970 [Candidatus Binatia bacterium]|nr:hypothetical protein [Candidatus Binatia bacterium]
MVPRTAESSHTSAHPQSPRARKRGVATLVLAALAMAATLTACPEKKGPAEKAGEAVDNAGEKLKDAVTPDGPAEKLGEKIDKATD